MTRNHRSSDEMATLVSQAWKLMDKPDRDIWFGMITWQAIHGGTFSSVKQLVITIENYMSTGIRPVTLRLDC